MITKATGKKINPNVMTERLLIWMRTSKKTAAKNDRSTRSRKPLLTHRDLDPLFSNTRSPGNATQKRFKPAHAIGSSRVMTELS